MLYYIIITKSKSNKLLIKLIKFTFNKLINKINEQSYIEIFFKN